MDNKFLPAPWEYHKEFKEICSGVYLICKIPDGQYSEANVNLMIASPEMYEACNGLLEFISTFSVGGDDWHRENYPAIKKARAALKKARGEHE